jgi:branched-chain amino acid transport system substrate-binding protein
MRACAIAILSGALSLSAAMPASSQQTIRVGELNSYAKHPAFLEPYKKGWQMAIDEINGAGGVLGKKLEVVSRDDGGNPGDAARVADELAIGQGLNILCGTFLSNVGLAITEFAGKRKVFFLAAEPLTDKITWQDGNRYTFRLRPSTYMQVAMLLPEALAAKKKRWALVYPNYEYGQSAAAAFKELMKAHQRDIEFVTEQASPLGKIDAGAVAQAIDDTKPDAIFSALFGSDLTTFVREGGTRSTFKVASWSICLVASRNISILSRTRRRSAGSSPAIPGTRSLRPSTRLSLPLIRSATRTIRGSVRSLAT